MTRRIQTKVVPIVGAIAFLALGAAWMLASDGPTYPRPWSPYARLEKTHELQIIPPYEFDSREDCMHAVSHELAESSKDSGSTDEISQAISKAGMDYGEPSGCLYMGYQNRYVLYFVNIWLNGRNFRCIMKVTSSDLKKSGYTYYPALPVVKEDDKQYCVL